MELVVVSGKGGTGKTSLVGALASLANRNVLVDCDVDAADLHLIVGADVKTTNQFIGGKRASIDENICIGCGLCASYCRFDAIEPVNGAAADTFEKFRISELACDGCGVCVRHCPEQAIAFDDAVSGEWYISDTTHGPMVHARLGMAQANSGKLVSLLRQQARQLADEHKLDLTIIDGPPGIGCPVIAATTGADYILIVTEPSMSAMHDMERLLELTAHFGVPTGICINKWDINPDMTRRIEESAGDKGAKVLGRLPFDPSVTKAQLAGATVIEHTPSGVSSEIRRLWARVKDEIGKKKFAV